MIYYLIFGVGFYTGLAIARIHTFQNASPWSIVKGIIGGVFLWPLVIFIILRYDP